MTIATIIPYITANPRQKSRRFFSARRDWTQHTEYEFAVLFVNHQDRRQSKTVLAAGKLVLEESPLLIWCLANAVEIQNNYGDIKLSKKHKDDTERIDPAAAVMNALARALVRKNSPTLADALSRPDFSL